MFEVSVLVVTTVISAAGVELSALMVAVAPTAEFRVLVCSRRLLWLQLCLSKVPLVQRLIGLFMYFMIR